VHTYNIDQGGKQAPTADTNIIQIAVTKPTAEGIANAMSVALLAEINVAVRVMNQAKETVTTAQEAYVSRSKEVGVLLLRLRELNPDETFEDLLSRIEGLHRTVAYDCMRVAGGRTTVEEIRAATAERVRKHREKRAKSLPQPEPVSVTCPDVTDTPGEADPESAEASEAECADPPQINVTEPEAEPETIEAAEAEVKRLKALKAQIKANGGNDEIGPEQAKALAEFKAACAALLPKMAGDALQQAINYFAEAVEIPAEELMPDLQHARMDVKIAKAEVATLKRKLAGKLPPRESRAAAWARVAGEAVANVEELINYQQECEEAKEGQPDGLQDGPFAQKCEEICGIDLQGALDALLEAEGAEVPLGFGRD